MSPGGRIAHNHNEPEERVQTHYSPKLLTMERSELARHVRSIVEAHRQAQVELAGIVVAAGLPGGAALMSSTTALGEASSALRGDQR